MANIKRADKEWLWHMQEDIQSKINLQRRQRNYKKRNRRLQTPPYPSVKDLYGAAIKNEDY